jgi:hypothetical protein
MQMTGAGKRPAHLQIACQSMLCYVPPVPVMTRAGAGLLKVWQDIGGCSGSQRTSPATAVLRALAAFVVGLLQGRGPFSLAQGPFREPARSGVLGMLCAGVLASGSGQRCRARTKHRCR